MTDISKCEGKILTKDDKLRECERKKTCYRYQAKSSQMQSFIRPQEVDGRCAHYWSIND